MFDAVKDGEIVDIIPVELRALNQWVLWKYETKGGNKPTKVPYTLDGSRASSTDSNSWLSFVDAYSSRQGYSGIGFMLTAPYTGIDLDGCIDDEGNLREWACEIVEKLSSVAYGEVSPSGTGIKFLTQATKPPGARSVKKIGKGKQQIECYDRARFWTMTGKLYGNEFATIGDGQRVIDWLANEYLTTKSPKPSKAKSNSAPIHIERAKKYLAKMEPAISGNGGSNACFNSALAMVKGFELTADEAFDLLTNDYNYRCEPEWTERELRHKIESAVRSDVPSGYIVNRDSYGNGSAASATLDMHSSERAPIDSNAALYDLANDAGRTDTANSLRFVDMFARELLFVPPWKKWLSWNGAKWSDDCGVGSLQRAKRYTKALWKELAKLAPKNDKDDVVKVVSFVKLSNQTPRITAFLKLASVDERVVCPVDELNSDPTLLNCINGTVDLNTGKLRPHNPADRITQITAVAFDPQADCPRWLETLDLIFDGNAELIAYVQRLLGYSLSGETGEHILPIAWGGGNNGKSTIWNTIADLLGEYATLANDELLLGDKNNHPTEKAALYQKRFVAISEPEQNSKLKESRVKELTGDRIITARRVHEDFWTFERTHTFWLSTNHLPRIDGTDLGIWRRVKLIPFTVDLSTKVKPIPDFDKWLVQNEGRGILAWMVRGYLDYRDHGLGEPSVVTKATNAYRSDSDVLADFIAEHCIEDQQATISASLLYRVYAEKFGGNWKQATFGRAIGERYQKRKSNGKIVYSGIKLRADSETDVSDEKRDKHEENDIEGGLGRALLLGSSTDTHIQHRPPNYPQLSPELNFDNVAPPPSRSIACPKCGENLVPAETSVGGWRNWDCPKCRHVKPVNESTAEMSK